MQQSFWIQAGQQEVIRTAILPISKCNIILWIYTYDLFSAAKKCVQ